MTTNRKYFSVNTMKYVPNTNYQVYCPASLNKVKNNAVMFITDSNMDRADVLQNVNECLIFWPDSVSVDEYVAKHNAVVTCIDPHLEYCRFFKDNHIDTLPQKVSFTMVDGACIADGSICGINVTIMPGAYIGPDVNIGNDVFIGSGSKLQGRIHIGNHVIIRENTVIGADGLTTDRDVDGKSIVMPQFGDVVIEDDVQIGAGTVIARGAIDSTIIRSGCRIDNACFISHNVEIGRDTFIVGESIMFGSSSTGEKVLISGNSSIRNGIHIGNYAVIGMGSVVVKSVADGAVVKGNPAK